MTAPRSHDRQTLEFYAAEAGAYAERSDRVGNSRNLSKFIGRMPTNAAVLDLGCGTGRDTRALIDAGFDVTAIDGSPEMAREAESRIGRPVRVLLFEDLDYAESFDGVWANASLLHVPRDALGGVLERVHRALKPDGLLFASFKSGGREGRDTLGRYYNYLSKEEVAAFVRAAGAWASIELGENRGKGYDGEEVGIVECFARRAS